MIDVLLALLPVVSFAVAACLGRATPTVALPALPWDVTIVKGAA